jgi:hypothetical protein
MRTRTLAGGTLAGGTFAFLSSGSTGATGGFGTGAVTANIGMTGSTPPGMGVTSGSWGNTSAGVQTLPAVAAGGTTANLNPVTVSAAGLSTTQKVLIGLALALAAIVIFAPQKWDSPKYA